MFGPTREDPVLSESGKRLRVEKDSRSLRGGIFADGTEMERVVNPLLQLRDGAMIRRQR